ncbi:MAG TPA: hypothetical protein PKD67_11565 [Ignavibacteriaceae bacterium]|nr:hypothetical protein [Ignavibacteriaceae bacterium]
MADKYQKIKNDFLFVLNEIKQISLNRNFENAIIKSNLLSLEIENWTNDTNADELESMKNSIINLIDDLRFVIKTEMRFILFPLPDIKKETYEIGKKYMPNFLEWLNLDESYTPEKIMGILEEEMYELDEAKEDLLEITF